MSSLWSLIKKQKIGFVHPFTENSISGLKKNPPEPKLITVSDHFEAWACDESADFGMEKMDATPMFPALWVEWLYNDCRNATLITREAPHVSYSLERPSGACFFMRMTMFDEEDGYAVMRAGSEFFIDRLGCLCGEVAMLCSTQNQGATGFRMLFVCNILTTINTLGTHVEPPFHSKSVEIVKPNRAPCSVWHTIHLPKFVAPPLDNAEISGEILERREHWVRAHRRDYRHGAGMFGRVKALVWVPEFQRGNPELGTVKQSYNVRQPEAAR